VWRFTRKVSFQLGFGEFFYTHQTGSRVSRVPMISVRFLADGRGELYRYYYPFLPWFSQCYLWYILLLSLLPLLLLLPFQADARSLGRRRSAVTRLAARKADVQLSVYYLQLTAICRSPPARNAVRYSTRGIGTTVCIKYARKLRDITQAPMTEYL